MAKVESSEQKNSPFAIASILVQMDSIELTRFEVAEYPFEVQFSRLFRFFKGHLLLTCKRLRFETASKRFVSDVGGSFGLFLGISAATIVGCIEMMIGSMHACVRLLSTLLK